MRRKIKVKSICNLRVLEEKDGSHRLLDLLNSLIFPNEPSKRIIEIKYISNEKGKITEKQDNSGIMRFDISCKVKILDEKKKISSDLDRIDVFDRDQ